MWIWTYLRTAGDNFGVVVPGRLYRSATPSPGNLAKWKGELGIKTWVDLRMPKDYIGSHSYFSAQCATAKKLGIERISLPLDDFGVVSDEQIQVWLDIACDETRLPILVGCRGARHRAGLLCAMYRMRVQGWSGEAALKEAVRRGYYRHGHETFDDRFMDLIGMPRN